MSRHPATASQFHKSKTLNDKYLLGDEIGKGAYGRVYKGVDLENGDFVAIKQVSLENIPPEDLASIMQEIDLLKNLNHKNIVKYQGSFKTKTHLYIILEYVENGSLASIVKPNKFGPLTESLVAYYIAQVLEGLAYLHEQGVIHRDIKGANLLITKESFVKLADFGVATKLTEADINTHSVVGTPYWMAPEVIEMSGVSASSDIWSVGCTVIELLTCIPPYYDLQPMPALFRIVQDERPPIPDHLSAGLTDFLHQCFQKDAKLRPDAKMLLKHSWIRNSQPLRSAVSSIPQGVSTVLDSLEDSQQEEKPASQEQADEDAKSSRPATTTSDADGTNGTATAHSIQEELPNGDQAVLVPSPPTEPMISPAVPESTVPSTTDEISVTLEPHRQSDAGEPKTESFTPDRLKSPPVEVEEDIQQEHVHEEPVQVLKTAIPELSKFSDTPEDDDLSDLFKLEEPMQNSGHRNTDLAKKLHDKMAQNREKKNGEGLLLFVGGEEFDSHGLEDGGKDYIIKQTVEVRRLFGLLKPQEPEEVIISTCQKLVYIFREFPDQKSHIISQHGVMPLLEMLELNNNRVSHAVLQLVNQVIRDNVAIQENACLVGLVPLVMNFAAPERSKEIRMQAALFVQQMCSSTLTLQMFIACRGLPVLVGFLEPDYSKYREMVHLAIDCMWQIFELKSPTPRNDFCRIFAKSGVLVRLVNTLHSLNEASSENRSRSAPLDPSRVLASHMEQPQQPSRPKSGQLDPLRVRYGGGAEQPEFPKPPQQVQKWSNPNDSMSFSDGKPVNLPGHVRQRSVSREKVLLQIPERVEKSSQTKGEEESNGPDSAEQLPHLLNMIEKEPFPPRPMSGPMYPRPAPEKSESYLPLLHHSNATRKTNGDLEMLITAVKERGDIHSIKALVQGSSSKPLNGASSSNGLTTMEAAASTSGLVSQSASGLLSLSGVLNGRPGSAASSGALTRLSTTFNADVAKEYLIKVAELLLEFSRADTTVKYSMCSLSLLIRLLTMLKKLEAPVLLKVLKCINELSKDPYTLEHLQRAEAIKHLVPLFEERPDGPFALRIHNQVLNALYNLCKINKRRQDQAAEAGIIPHLMHFITSNSPLKEVALPLLCDMAHASRHTREKLRFHKGLDVYLSLLDDNLWAVTALDSLAVCLAHDNEHRKVEQALLKKESVFKLVAFFQSCTGASFVHILEPFLKIITKSPRLNTALAVSGLTQFLVGRLDHQDAIARLNLLKLIKAVYEHHPRPKQLIVEHDLPSKLQKLIEERRDGERTGGTGGQVLVKQMATALLKALHINTVL